MHTHVYVCVYIYVYIYIFVYTHLHCVAFVLVSWSCMKRKQATHPLPVYVSLPVSLPPCHSPTLSRFLFICTGSNRAADGLELINCGASRPAPVCPCPSMPAIRSYLNSLSPPHTSLPPHLFRTCAKNTYTLRTWHRLNSNSNSNSKSNPLRK